ncbi:MAG: hypothetical protein MHPSP_000700 [Paramarteilia canceri]
MVSADVAKKGQSRTAFLKKKGMSKLHIKQKYIRMKPKIISSITPGTVVILLKGRHQGMRAVYLKQVHSGKILVTGPRQINGVPLLAISQKMVIATSAKVNVPEIIKQKVNKFKETYLKLKAKVDVKTLKPEELELFKEGRLLDAKLKEKLEKSQKLIDESIIAEIAKNEELKPLLMGYLKTPFSLSTKDKPHAMHF